MKIPMPKLKDRTEVINMKARTSGGLADTPAIKLKSTAIKVTEPMSISITLKATIP